VDAGTSTYFRDRARTAGRVAEAIHALCAARRGNYLCFFPSYAYLQMVHDAFGAGGPGWEVLVQTPSMAEAEREAFLARFDAENPGRLVGFAVLGGVFGEGIDLAGERLCGAVVVGVGLPGPSPERELVRTYFQEKLAAGFEYAYQYPGMNRVLQAAGRVIRSETDRGVVLLVDRRYASARYRRLFPDEWRPVGLPDAGGIARHVSAFWSDAGGAAPGDGAPDGKDPPNGEEAPP
jgi:DNA excision repair protein ERCC-2